MKMRILNEGIGESTNKLEVVSNKIKVIEKSVSQMTGWHSFLKVQYLEETLFKSMKMLTVRLNGVFSTGASDSWRLQHE